MKRWIVFHLVDGEWEQLSIEFTDKEKAESYYKDVAFFDDTIMLAEVLGIRKSK